MRLRPHDVVQLRHGGIEGHQVRSAPGVPLFSIAAALILASGIITSAPWPERQLPIAGDSVYGTVVDTAGQPVLGARVALIELGRATLTAADGSFGMGDVPSGRYTATVQRLGFAPLARQLTLPSSVAIVFRLVPSPLRFQAVTATATRGAIAPLASPLSTDALFGERLRREHEVSLAHALDGLAGVRTLSTGEQVGKPVVRGLSGPRVLALDNGLRMEDYSWSDEDGPSIDSRLAERVEVIRGPASVLYGSDAIGGVINVIPDDVPSARGRRSFVRGAQELYGATNNREVGGLLRLEGASGGFGWRATGIGRRGGNIHAPPGNEETPTGTIYDTKYHALNGEVAAGFHAERANGTLRYERYGGDFGILDGPPVPDDDVSGPLRRLADDRIQGITSWLIGDTRLETRSQWQRHALQELVGESRVGGARPSVDLLLRTSTTDVLLHHAYSGRLSGTLGASGLQQVNTSSGEYPLVPNARTTNGAAFVYEQATVGEWSVSAGARGDLHRVVADANEELQLAGQARTSSAVTGDVGLVYRPIDGLSLAANVGRAFRAPTLYELFTNGPHLGEARYEVGLTGARPETSLNTDLSVRWENGRFRGAVAGYHTLIDHYLYIEPTGEERTVPGEEGAVDTLPVYRYKQTSRATLTGVDLSSEVEALDVLTLRFRFDYVHGTNDATSEPLPRMPASRGDLEAELHTRVAGREPGDGGRERLLGHAYVSIGTRMVAKQSRLGPFDTPTDGYALLQLTGGISHELRGRPLFFDIRVRNALNSRYSDFLSRYKLFAYEPGRNIVFRLSTGL